MTIGSSTVVGEDDRGADTEPTEVDPPTRPAPPPGERARRRSSSSSRSSSRILKRILKPSLLALVVSLVPVVTAAVRAIGSDWVPVGDDALIAIRANDVLGGGALPWLGTWSGKSWAVGFNVHHPGPLFFDILSVPAALLPDPAGLVVGAALVNGTAIVGIWVLARRRGGELMAVTVLAAAAALAWSMGSDVLAEPWNVSALLLPYFCFCLLAWSLACGDIACLPWAGFLGSLLIQANLAFLPLVGGLAVFVVGLWLLDWRRGREILPADRSSRLRRLSLISAAVVAVCWFRPLFEQLFGNGYGNLTRLARSSIEESPTLGARSGTRAVADVVSLPPWWSRPAYSDGFGFGAFGNDGLPSLLPSLVSLVVMAGLLVWGFRLAQRRQDRTLAALVAIATALVAISLLTAKVTPVAGNFGTTAYQMRWLWPVGAFITLALVVTVVRSLAVDRSWLTGWATGGGLAVTVLFAGLNLPASHTDTTAPAGTIPVARDVLDELDDADLEGPLLVDCAEHLFDPYCEAVLAELQREGVEFVMRDPITLQQVGEEREWDGTNAAARITVAAGDRALDDRPDARRIALHKALSSDEQLELFFLQEDFKRVAAEGELRLNPAGIAVAGRGDLPCVDLSSGSPRIDGGLLVGVRPVLFGEHRRDLVAMAREDLIEVDAARAELLERYAELQIRWDEQTVAVFLEPLPEYRHVS